MPEKKNCHEIHGNCHYRNSVTLHYCNFFFFSVLTTKQYLVFVTFNKHISIIFFKLWWIKLEDLNVKSNENSYQLLWEKQFHHWMNHRSHINFSLMDLPLVFVCCYVNIILTLIEKFKSKAEYIILSTMYFSVSAHISLGQIFKN